MESITTNDGFTIDSNTESAADMRAALNIEEPTKVVEPLKGAPDSTTDAQAHPQQAVRAAQDETDKEAAKLADKSDDRNSDGTFKAKASDKPRANPNARIEQMRERQRLAEEKAAALETQLAALQPKPKAADPAKPAVAMFPAFDAWSTDHPDASYEDYIDARTDFRFAQKEVAKISETQVTHESAAQLERFDAYDAKIAVESAKDPNWLNAIDPKLRALQPISALKPGVEPRFGNVLAEAILRSDHPVGLLKHFTSHPDDAQRLSTLPPDAFFRALGSIEVKVEAAMDAAPVPGSAPKLAVSAAKPPIKPVGTSPNADTETPPGDDASDAEHERYWAPRRAKLRG